MSKIVLLHWSPCSKITRKDPGRHGFHCKYWKDFKRWEKIRLTTDIVQNHVSVGRRTEPLQNWVPAFIAYLSLSFSKPPFPSLRSWEKKTLFKLSFSKNEVLETPPALWGLCRGWTKSYQLVTGIMKSALVRWLNAPSSVQLKGSTKKLSKTQNGCHDFRLISSRSSGNFWRFFARKLSSTTPSLPHFCPSGRGSTPPPRRPLRRSASAPEAERAAPKAKRQLVATRQGNTAGATRDVDPSVWPGRWSWWVN